ncbi:MAG: PQQ-like beta-propeller repeat protein [Verrucomicrobia bacterium]|nr:PQQ-like beta-propeller repeat protein [Verrucomicrobiota bacterium]
MKAAVISAAILAVLLTHVSRVSADWPGYRGRDAAGVSETKTSPRQLTADSVKEAWRVTSDASFSEIAVAGDKALVFVMRGTGESVVCLDVATGNELWATSIDDKTNTDGNGKGPRATPAIANGKVYVYGSFMKLVCLDLAKGGEIWRHDIQAEYAGRSIGWGPAASAVLVDDLVVVVGGGPGKGILAFDAETGKEAWAVTDEVHTHATPTVATIGGQKQVICFMASGLVSVEPKAGAVLWRFSFRYNTSTAASPIVGGKNGDIVYCSAGYGVGAGACRISAADGKWIAEKLWLNGIQNHWASGVHSDGYIYCLDGFKNNQCPLICLDIETGATQWSQPGFGSQGGLIRVGDTLVVQTVSGELVLAEASPTAYKELGRLPMFQNKQCWIAPSYADGKVFTRSTTESVCLVPTAK